MFLKVGNRVKYDGDQAIYFDKFAAIRTIIVSSLLGSAD
jgi:hypothetical protein